MSDWEKIVRLSEDGIKIRVKVSPGASKTKITGPYGDSLKVAVNAPPEKGKANRELILLLAKSFNITKKQIRITSGETSTSKQVLMSGITAEDCIAALKELSKN